mmetsp:Transcript_8852/g.22270  ORF Transcript_8852/g.22270 Transcript_8852/m.22270 type:complete len:275 (-) Transcript_8852:207-1031(-)|eukprot:CAMPEP_0177680950 /NCGR_PEP_ID=MMETSP0447-20121125/30447_1 /TAXON_ID=0 /ORGANISM="Stygamoeba regulata, Strain BSH-02190019" /LENGTH=274 /DNA_ID=CAMNT_0019190317 /DNA_START=36 /DNA_END=860 /DNA_ORIENTATION=+
MDVSQAPQMVDLITVEKLLAWSLLIPDLCWTTEVCFLRNKFEPRIYNYLTTFFFSVGGGTLLHLFIGIPPGIVTTPYFIITFTIAWLLMSIPWVYSFYDLQVMKFVRGLLLSFSWSFVVHYGVHLADTRFPGNLNASIFLGTFAGAINAVAMNLEKVLWDLPYSNPTRLIQGSLALAVMDTYLQPYRGWVRTPYYGLSVEPVSLCMGSVAVVIFFLDNIRDVFARRTMKVVHEFVLTPADTDADPIVVTTPATITGEPKKARRRRPADNTRTQK